MLSALILAAAPALKAQELVMDGSTFGKRGWSMTQAVDISRLQTLLDTGQMEPVSAYGPESVFGRLAQVVGYLDVARADGQSEKCTALLIAPDLILTNAHCVFIKGGKRARSVMFVTGYLTTVHAEGEREYAASPKPLERNEALDYAILKLDRPVEGYRQHAFSVRDPRKGEPLLVIGHPLGQPLHLVRGGCQALRDRPVYEMRVNHKCDTLGGNSGGPIFSDEDRSVIVGLHHAGGTGANHGIRMTSLVAESEMLRGIFSTQATAAQPRAAEQAQPRAQDPALVTADAPEPARQFVADWSKPPKLLRTLEGHKDGVRSAAFSPDGGAIVSASADNTVKIWDARTGQLLRTLEGHTSYVISAAFSPDGGAIVSASDDNTVKIWDARTGRLLRTLEGHKGWVNSAAFSPDGGAIVSASGDKTLKIWDARTGRLLRTLEGHTEPVYSAAFSPDGGAIVSASLDKTVKIWDARTGRLLHTLEGHKGWVFSAAFSPDGGAIVSASEDKTVKIWDARTGQLLRTLEGHKGWVYSAAFSPDGGAIVSASGDNTLKIWEARTGQLLRTLEGHKDWVLSAAFSPDGGAIVSASDNTVKIWAVAGEMR
jgi:WD40 repeat protein